MSAEQIVAGKIAAAFSLTSRPEDAWIAANPYVFEQVSAAEAKELMPAYMMFVLARFRADPGSLVYMRVLYALNDYSKCKGADGEFWRLLSRGQQNAVLAFVQHLLHNQPANTDQDTLRKIMGRWQGIDNYQGC